LNQTKQKKRQPGAFLYGKYAGTEIEYEGKAYLIMREADILAII
jgi:co-chaperonin GroES (HSP10)